MRRLERSEGADRRQEFRPVALIARAHTCLAGPVALVGNIHDLPKAEWSDRLPKCGGRSDQRTRCDLPQLASRVGSAERSLAILNDDLRGEGFYE